MKARIKKRGLPFRDVTAVKFEGQVGWFSADDVEFECEDTSYWATIRYEAAIAVMQGLLSNENYSSYTAKKVREESEEPTDVFLKTISKDAVEIADALIKELKGE